jgi:hypothetical protein
MSQNASNPSAHPASMPRARPPEGPTFWRQPDVDHIGEFCAQQRGRIVAARVVDYVEAVRQARLYSGSAQRLGKH